MLDGSDISGDDDNSGGHNSQRQLEAQPFRAKELPAMRVMTAWIISRCLSFFTMRLLLLVRFVMGLHEVDKGGFICFVA